MNHPSFSETLLATVVNSADEKVDLIDRSYICENGCCETIRNIILRRTEYIPVNDSAVQLCCTEVEISPEAAQDLTDILKDAYPTLEAMAEHNDQRDEEISLSVAEGHSIGFDEAEFFGDSEEGTESVAGIAVSGKPSASIEALRYTGDNFEELRSFTGGENSVERLNGCVGIYVASIQDDKQVNPGDTVLKYEDGTLDVRNSN